MPLPTIRKIHQFCLRTARRLPLPKSPRWRKPLVGILGVGILLVGLVMIVLPGPAILVIPAGLALLSMEFGIVRHGLRGAAAPPPRPCRPLSTQPSNPSFNSII